MLVCMHMRTSLLRTHSCAHIVFVNYSACLLAAPLLSHVSSTIQLLLDNAFTYSIITSAAGVRTAGLSLDYVIQMLSEQEQCHVNPELVLVESCREADVYELLSIFYVIEHFCSILIFLEST